MEKKLLLITILFFITTIHGTHDTEVTAMQKANIANNFIATGELKKALFLYTDIIKEIPNNADIWHNIGYVCKLLAKPKHALCAYKKSIALNPQHKYTPLGLAKAHLMLGQFKKGWEYFEYRYQNVEKYKQKKMDLSSFAGKHIIILSEWGLGDTIQFVRYVKKIKELGAKSITVSTPKPLIPLFSTCPYISKAIPKDQVIKTMYDIQIPILSLPFLFDTIEKTIPTPIPYMYAAPHLINYWKQTLQKDTNIKVGLCWHAKPIPLEKHPLTRRSIPLAQFSVLSEVPGITFYSLQQIYGTEQLENLPQGFIVKSFSEDFDKTHGRFMDTAAVIKNLDLVISVDTSIVHLSGALGTNTWVLIPSTPEWRWMLDREDSPWYPNNMRLFRRGKDKDWNTIMVKVAKQLNIFVKNHTKNKGYR